MKSIIKLFGITVLILVASCHSESSNEELSDFAYSEIPNKNTYGFVGEFSDQESPQVEKKLVKKGRVEFESDNVATTKQQILNAVEKYKGYISSDQEYKSANRLTNTLSIRIPADNFDGFLSEATEGVNKFDSKIIEVKDVTEEFLDIQARLKTKKELESRYLELLKKASNVEEMLAVEEQIGTLRSDIESIEGRLKYLENRVSFSELSITIYQKISSETEFGRTFKNGFKNGWENLILFFILLVNIWPFIIVLMAIIIGISYWRKKKK